MRVVILNSSSPFVRGRAEILADSLEANIRRRGHQVATIHLPFKRYPPDRVIHQILAARLLNLDAARPDMVIPLKFPAYLAPADNKRVWLLHQFKQVYEFWGTPLQGMPDQPETRRIRQMVMRADSTFLRQATAIHTISHAVADRLQRFNGITANSVLYPPVPCEALYHSEEQRGFFFYPSRLNPSKRQDLVIDALRYVDPNVSLVIAGKADNDGIQQQLEQKVAELGLTDRVRLMGWVADEVKAELMAQSIGVAYVPYDEDYGYVTVEAFRSHKPVITCLDSAGSAELVHSGFNGLVVEPSAEAIGWAMQRLGSEPGYARDLGENAFSSLKTMGLDWDHVMDELLL